MPVKLVSIEEKNPWEGVKPPVFARCIDGVSKGILYVTGISNCSNALCGVKLYEDNKNYAQAGEEGEDYQADTYEPIPPGEKIIFENT